MTERETNLIKIATKYKTPQEFKQKNLSKYLLAKKARLLDICFPKKEDKKLKGIYYLYYRHIVVYIGYSLVDLEASIDSHKESTMNYDYAKYWCPHSDSDTVVLYHYLCQKYRPRYNTNTGKDTLTIELGNVMPIMGKATRREK